MTPRQLSNISEIMEKMEPRLSQGVGIPEYLFSVEGQRSEGSGGDFMGYEEESGRLLEHYRDTWKENIQQKEVKAYYMES